MRTGTYVGASVLQPVLTQLKKYICQHKIPQTQEDNFFGLHSTIIWSKKPCPLIMPDKKSEHHARATGLTVFCSDKKFRLALLLYSPSLEKRHSMLMVDHEATHDFPIYTPHITIGYDIGSFSWWNLPPFPDTIILGNEVVRTGYPAKKRTVNAELALT